MRVYIAILNQIAKRSFACIYVPFTASKAFDALFIKLFVWLLVGCEIIYVTLFKLYARIILYSETDISVCFQFGW